MAKKILVSYDFNGNEVQNVKAHIVAGDPGAPAEGQFWYNSVSKRLKWRKDNATIDPLERANHAGTQSADTITDGTTNKAYTATEKTKLAGIATGATANDTDANLKNRANHTGTQLAATISDFASAVLGGVLTGLSTATNAAIAATDGILVAFGKLQAQISAHFGSGGAAHADVVAGGAAGFMTGAQATKLAGIATGATANSSDATLLARANHTGTQTASTISDFNTAVRTNRLDQMAAPTAAVSLNSQKITSLADGTAATDAATYGQLQAVATGRAFKDAVRAATTANITLSGTQTIDGVAVIVGDRVLVKNQATGAQNGIYVVAAGAWARAADADNTSPDSEVKTGMTVGVSEGTTQADQQWTLTTNGAITIGTTALAFALTGGNAMYVQSTGIAITGNAIAVDTAVVVRKYAATIGDGAATSITITHNLGTKDITYSVRQVADDAFVECDVVASSTTQTAFSFAVAPALNSLRVVVHA